MIGTDENTMDRVYICL